MRVLHLLASPYWSGPAENTALLALEQRALGHQVTVAIDRLRHHAGSEELAEPRFRALDLLDDGGLELSVKSPPWRTWSDARKLAARKLDAVHCHFTHDHFVARLGRPRGAALIRSIHAPRSIRWSLPYADAYTVPTEEDAFRLGKRVVVLPALVDPKFVLSADRAALRNELGIEGSPIIGMVSTFQPSRRHDLGVEAFALLHKQQPAARLVLVGDGVMLAPTRERVRALCLDAAVTFAGYQSGDGFVHWLQAMDCVWILGLGNDWSGRAAAQAHACGVRVVVVELGALSRYAEAVAQPEAASIVECTLGLGEARDVLGLNAETAADVMRLYERASKPAP